MAEPTDLEAAVLGIVWKDGPCTPYSIRSQFVSSHAPRWSGSAGAIYPLIRRLEQRGLVKSSPSGGGRGRGRDYRLTRRGLTALRGWVRPPVSESDAGVTYDPLRTRSLFLAALSADDAERFVTDAIDAVRRRLAAIQSEPESGPSHPDLLERLASRSGVLVMHARLKWLRELQDGLRGR